MSKAKNPQIGTCPCPIAGCAQTMALYRFRERTEDDKRRRYGGKIYGHCPDHGRIGGTVNAPAMQDYLLEKGTVWAPNAPAARAADLGKTPENTGPAPEKTPEKAAPRKSVDLWDM